MQRGTEAAEAEIILSHCSALPSWQLSFSTALKYKGNPERKPKVKKTEVSRDLQGQVEIGLLGPRKKRMEEEDDKSHSRTQRGNNLLP